ncbi:MAG: pyridoxine 5'-phosphate synthase [Aaplasma endosymbiont of Hyalomma asiaticum]
MVAVKLGVNVDHVATLRNIRGTPYPNLVEIVQIVADSGADFITVHLREDRRHIRDGDLQEILRNVRLPLNLEMAATDEMIKIAKELRPDSVCLVPEKRMEMTTETGLDAKKLVNSNSTVVSALQAEGIKVVLFLDPDATQVSYARRLNVDKIELHVGAYCMNRTKEEFARIVAVAQQCEEYGIECHAGHGLDYSSAAQVAGIRQITAINVGHFLVCEALKLGIGEAVRKMRDVITAVRTQLGTQVGQ